MSEKFPSTVFGFISDSEGESVFDRMSFGETVEDCMEDIVESGVVLAVYELKKLVRARTTVTITEEKNGGRKQRQRSASAKQKSA